MNQRNLIQNRFEAENPALGVRCMTHSPMMIEVYGALGFDFVWVDFEHDGRSPEDHHVLGHLVRTADAADIDLLVRLPGVDPDLIRKVLDSGIRTILLPRIETADEVRKGVKAARFWYDEAPGDRGVAFGRPATWGLEATDYPTKEDESVLVGVMIENQTAVNNFDSILAVPELGFTFIGPADLSVSLGHPLDTDHHGVQETITEIRDVSLAADIPVGRIANTVSTASEAIAEGYSLLRMGDELAAARRVLGDRVSAVRNAV